MRLNRKKCLLIVVSVCSLYIYHKNLQEQSLAERDRTSDEEVQLSHKQTGLGDIFISVKTTRANHKTRLQLQLDTWVKLTKGQTFFFTDSNDDEYQQKSNGHIINTNCSGTHRRKALCCKTGFELDYFLRSDKRWFCHVDDDIYLNIYALLALLKDYNHTRDWYLGKPSLGKQHIPLWPKTSDKQMETFEFATGAGYCLSRKLAEKIGPYGRGLNMVRLCFKTSLPDDITMGYLVYHYGKAKLTRIDEFRSHLRNSQSAIKMEDLHNQITFSYKIDETGSNVVSVTGFDRKLDPTRFLSLHCFLYPMSEGCKGLKQHDSSHTGYHTF